jgi:hypothetical protein
MEIRLWSMGVEIFYYGEFDGRRNKRVLVKIIGGDKYISLSFLSG